MSRTTKAQKAVAKRLLSREPGQFEPIDLTGRRHPEWLTRAFSNNRYVVMINDNALMHIGANVIDAVRVMVQRHDDKPLTRHWQEMQCIKNELFGPNAVAIEFYPAEAELMDDANIYWLWIVPAVYLPVPVYPI